MTEASGPPPRLGSVAFRGVSSRLPPRSQPVPETTQSDDATMGLPGDPEPPARERQPKPPSGSPKRSQLRDPPERPERKEPGDAPRTTVGTGQLHARLPPYVATWIRSSGQTQRSALLAALAEYGDEVPASRDPVILSRLRLGLPVRPVQKRRGSAEGINFSLTGEEKALIERRAAELQLSITDFVAELLVRACDASPPALRQ